MATFIILLMSTGDPGQGSWPPPSQSDGWGWTGVPRWQMLFASGGGRGGAVCRTSYGKVERKKPSSKSPSPSLLHHYLEGSQAQFKQLSLKLIKFSF